MGSVGRGVQWDTVTEYHVVPVHCGMCKYTIIPSSPRPSRPTKGGPGCEGGHRHKLRPLHRAHRQLALLHKVEAVPGGARELGPGGLCSFHVIRYTL